MFRRALIGMMMGLLLGGCTQAWDWAWSKPGVSANGVRDAVFDCRQKATSASAADLAGAENVFIECMERRGFRSHEME